jgi:hypothetical protein
MVRDGMMLSPIPIDYLGLWPDSGRGSGNFDGPKANRVNAASDDPNRATVSIRDGSSVSRRSHWSHIKKETYPRPLPHDRDWRRMSCLSYSFRVVRRQLLFGGS